MLVASLSVPPRIVQEEMDVLRSLAAHHVKEQAAEVSKYFSVANIVQQFH